MFKWKRIATVAAFMAGIISATSTAFAQSASLFDEIKSRGVLHVATMTTIPPFAFKDESGEIVGVDIDIAKLIARELLGDETKVEFTSVNGDGRWPAVLTGQADMGIATLYMSRANNLAFTPPVYEVGITLLVGANSDFKTLEDINKAEVTVANLNNSQMDKRAKTYFPNATLQTFDQVSAQLLALRSGRAQAMQIDTAVADFYAKQNEGQIKVMSNVILGDVLHNAIFSKPDDPRWSKWLDTFARELTGGSLYGDYRKIYEKWYAKAPPAQSR